MIRRAPPLAAALLLLFWLAACSSAPELPPLAPDATVLAFGDSLTAGTGARRGEAYPAVLEALIDRRVINAGVPGETTAEGLRRLPGVLEEHAPDLVILCLGGNDMLRKLPVADAKANLARMIGTIRERGAAVVLLGVPAPGLLLSTAEYYRELADELGVPLEDEALAGILADRDLKADPIHPNAAGYRRLAEALREFLVDKGAL